MCILNLHTIILKYLLVKRSRLKMILIFWKKNIGLRAIFLCQEWSAAQIQVQSLWLEIKESGNGWWLISLTCCYRKELTLSWNTWKRTASWKTSEIVLLLYCYDLSWNFVPRFLHRTSRSVSTEEKWEKEEQSKF